MASPDSEAEAQFIRWVHVFPLDGAFLEGVDVSCKELWGNSQKTAGNQQMSPAADFEIFSYAVGLCMLYVRSF